MRPITHCLNPTLTALCQHSIKLESLSAIIQHYLPESYAAHCMVGSFNKGCLILTVSDPVWASELRFHIPQLRDHLRHHAKLHQLVAIKIQLRPAHVPLTSSTTTTKPPHILSTKARQSIQQSSEQCTYPPLKQALIKLSSRGH